MTSSDQQRMSWRPRSCAFGGESPWRAIKSDADCDLFLVEEGIKVGLSFDFGEARYLRCSVILRNEANEYIAGCGEGMVVLHFFICFSDMSFLGGLSFFSNCNGNGSYYESCRLSSTTTGRFGLVRNHFVLGGGWYRFPYDDQILFLLV